MKYALLLISFLLLVQFCIAQKQTKQADQALLIAKIDSLQNIVKRLENNQKNDTLLIKIDQLSAIFKKSDSGGIEKLIPALIAFLTVFVSSFVAYKIGKGNIAVQQMNAEKQTKAQLSIAADNLFMSKEQLEQNTKNNLAQIKANNISKARIEWINNLRPLLSDFFANISIASMILKDMLEAARKKDRAKTDENYLKFEDLLNKMQAQENQIQLYLNPEKDSHNKLIKSITEYMKTLNSDWHDKNESDLPLSADVIENARTVIKEAWEKAKSETSNT